MKIICKRILGKLKLKLKLKYKNRKILLDTKDKTYKIGFSLFVSGI